MSIFSKVIGYKISYGSRRDFYMRCRTNFASDTIQTETPQFVDMVILTIDELDECSGLSNPDTRTRRGADGSHWSAHNHIFGLTTSVGVSEANS